MSTRIGDPIPVFGIPEWLIKMINRPEWEISFVHLLFSNQKDIPTMVVLCSEDGVAKYKTTRFCPRFFRIHSELGEVIGSVSNLFQSISIEYSDNDFARVNAEVMLSKDLCDIFDVSKWEPTDAK